MVEAFSAARLELATSAAAENNRSALAEDACIARYLGASDDMIEKLDWFSCGQSRDDQFSARS